MLQKSKPKTSILLKQNPIHHPVIFMIKSIELPISKSLDYKNVP